MKFTPVFIVFILLQTLPIQAQTHSGFSLGVSGSYSPDLQFYNDSFTKSQSLNFQASYFDSDYTRMEYGLNYSRGFDSTVSYVFGLTAAAVFQLTDQMRLKPGIGVQEFKMADRSCRTTWRTVLDSIFDIDSSCSDDVHASFIGFANLEYQLTEPVSVFLQTTYRTMLSNVRRENVTGSATEHSFYSSGMSFSAGIRFYFF